MCVYTQQSNSTQCTLQLSYFLPNHHLQRWIAASDCAYAQTEETALEGSAKKEERNPHNQHKRLLSEQNKVIATIEPDMIDKRKYVHT